MKKLFSPLGGAIGSEYLKKTNQLLFVEYSGSISTLDLVRPLASTVSSGTAIIKGTWAFDCESGTIGNLSAPFDIWWEQKTAVLRQMTPQGISTVVNLGQVDFNLVTPQSMQSYDYSSTPICGNNDATNKLPNNDVFCVKTREGNFCKIKVITYGYDLKVQWVTYQLASPYTKIGTGYSQPEDIAVLASEATAYVTERTGNLLKVALPGANRSAAVVIASGMTAPHQIWLDEAHFQAYVVEFASPGRLFRIDLSTGVKTVLYSSLNLGIGLVLTSNLQYAYVSEQGTSSISRITLATGVKTTIATGLTNPFFLSWSDASETTLLVAERDPVNRVSMVDISKTTLNVKVVMAGTGFRPSSVALIKPGTFCVFCDTEIDQYDILASSSVTGLYMGIGYVPWNLITANGKANTGGEPLYLYQFPADSPFGGTLPVKVDHRRAFEAGLRYYRVLIDGIPRNDSWYDLRMNPANGKFEFPEQMKTEVFGGVSGFYPVHNPVNVYYNSDLGCSLDSNSGVGNGLHTFSVEFYDAAHLISPPNTTTHNLFIDNNFCVATLDMPLLDGHSADTACGYLKYVDKTHPVTMRYVASHPINIGSYSLSIVKGANLLDSIAGPVNPLPFTYTKTVAALLGSCNIAAFAVSLYVATSVINGVGRQSQYDRSALIAFCLAT